MIYITFKRLALASLLLAFALPALAAPDAGTAGREVDVRPGNGFVPHKALYNIKLAGTKSGSQIVNVTGQMLYEWQPTCDAWISNHRFNLYYEYADTPSMRIASDFSTYEPFDGSSIDFTSQRKRDRETIEELRGSATLDETGAGIAAYTKPTGLEFDLPAGSMFPLMHTKNIVKAIREGKKFYSAVVFDGSDSDGPVQISAVIGGPKEVPDLVKSSKAIDQSLLKSPARELRMAYFPLVDSSESADYEMTILFHENGIISDMSVEYDDFSITQKLVALEAMPDNCDAHRKKSE